MPGFLGTHPAAPGSLVASIVAGGLLEWMVTLRERAGRRCRPVRAPRPTPGSRSATLGEVTLTRTSGDAPEDRGTKRLIVGSAAAALLLGVLAARRVPSLELPGSGWAWFALGLALVWAGFGLRIWAIATLGRFFRRVVVVQEEHVVVRTGPYRLDPPSGVRRQPADVRGDRPRAREPALPRRADRPARRGAPAAHPRGRGRAHAGARRALSSATPRRLHASCPESGETRSTSTTVAGPPRREDRCATKVPRSAGVHGPPSDAMSPGRDVPNLAVAAGEAAVAARKTCDMGDREPHADAR